MLAILGSREAEIIRLQEQMTVDSEQRYAGIVYLSGAIDGAPVVLAMTGSDRVRAAAATQIVMDRFDVNEAIFLGSAQPLVPFLQQGDLVVAERLWQYDQNRLAATGNDGDVTDDESILSSDYGMVRRLGDAYKDLFSRQSNRPQLIPGAVVSADHRSFGRKTIGLLHRRFGVVAADYTGAAFAEVCCMNDVSFVVLHTVTEISPDAGPGSIQSRPNPKPEHSTALVREILTVKSPAPVV
jgi:adenosylhomocysteine nucleosidase